MFLSTSRRLITIAGPGFPYWPRINPIMHLRFRSRRPAAISYQQTYNVPPLERCFTASSIVVDFLGLYSRRKYHPPSLPPPPPHPSLLSLSPLFRFLSPHFHHSSSSSLHPFFFPFSSSFSSLERRLFSIPRVRSFVHGILLYLCTFLFLLYFRLQRKRRKILNFGSILLSTIYNLPSFGSSGRRIIKLVKISFDSENERRRRLGEKYSIVFVERRGHFTRSESPFFSSLLDTLAPT